MPRAARAACHRYARLRVLRDARYAKMRCARCVIAPLFMLPRHVASAPGHTTLQRQSRYAYDVCAAYDACVADCAAPPCLTMPLPIFRLRHTPRVFCRRHSRAMPHDISRHIAAAAR